MRKTWRLRCLEMDKGKPLETLIREGIEQGMSWEELAEDLGVSRVTLHSWATRMGAEIIRTVRFPHEEQMQERA